MKTRRSSERQRGIERRAHPPSGGARWISGIRCPGSTGTLDRHRFVWLRPSELPHPDGVLDGPLRRFMSALVAERQARTGFGRFLSFGAGDTVRIHRRSPEAIRLRSEGLPTGYGFGSSASRPLRRSADGRIGIGVICQPHSKQQPTYRELLGASGVGAKGRSVEGQPPVVLRQSWAHPSGRNRVRRSSLVSFGTHLPTSNVPTWVRGTSAGVIFGWR